jgi:hypothetical protein
LPGPEQGDGATFRERLDDARMDVAGDQAWIWFIDELIVY